MSFNEAKNLVRSKCFIQPRISFAAVTSKAVAPKNAVDLEPCNGTKLFSFNATSSIKSGSPTPTQGLVLEQIHRLR